MSRFGDDYDENSMPYELWQANVGRALKGRRGRQVLRDLRDALLALPEPRLIEGALCTVGSLARMEATPDWGQHAALGAKVEEQGEGVCGIGAYLWHKKVKAGTDPADAFALLPTLLDTDSDLWETADLARRAGGITFTLAWDLAMRNDETYGGLTPEERYEKFLAWIDRELGAEVSAGA